MNYVDLNAIRNASSKSHPFTYAQILNCLHKNDAETLIKTLPKDNYYQTSRVSGSDKTYNVTNSLLKELSDDSPYSQPNLNENWQLFLDDLQSKEYILALSTLCAVDLTECFQEITLKRYGIGNYISPHTDKACVTATHLLFLNLEWRDDWAGNLCFLEDGEHIFARFKPLYSNSVVFVRADNSWHSVEKVENPCVERIAIQVAFWNTRKKIVPDGRHLVEKKYG